MIILLAVLAVSIPLAVLGQELLEGEETAEDESTELMLMVENKEEKGEGPPMRPPLQPRKRRWREGKGGILPAERVDEIVEELDLTEQEKARLEELMDDIEVLHDELEEKRTEIWEILKPKLKERAEQERDECQEASDEVKDMADEIKELYEKLKEAIADGEDSEAEEIKEEIAEKREALRDMFRERVDECRGPWQRRIREKVEKVRSRRDLGEIVRKALSEIKESDDEDSISPIKQRISDIREGIQQAMKSGDEESLDELRNRIREIANDIRSYLDDRGLRCPFAECTESAGD